MTGRRFFVYITLSLELVFGEYGIENKRNLYHVAIDQNTATDQEYQNMSELRQEGFEKIQKSFSLPKALAIGATMLAVPALGYKIYNRKQQEETLNKSETAEKTIDKSETIEETPRTYFWKGLTIDELPILIQQFGRQWTGYFDGLNPTKDEEMTWKPGVTGSQATYGYSKHPTGSLKVEDLNSSIRVEWPDGIYSPEVYNNSTWLFASARRFDLPPYRLRKEWDEKDAYHIEHTFRLWKNDEYLKQFRNVYGPRFDEVESKKIDEMIDDLSRDEEEITVAKIKTNLPVGFAVEVQSSSWTGRGILSFIICAHGLDANTGETIVSLACQGGSLPVHIGVPLHAFQVIPEHMLRTALRTFAYIALNTLPQQQHQVDQSTDIRTSATDLVSEDKTTLAVGNDKVDGSA